MAIPKRRRLQLVLFAFAVLVAFGFLLEGACRVFFQRIARARIVADPGVADLRIPDPPTEADAARYPALAAQNGCVCSGAANCRIGNPFRDQTFSCAPDPSVTRILFLGESSVWGTMLAADRTIPAQVARIAGQRGSRVEAINGGIQGEDLATCYRVAAVLLPRVHPDAVVIYAAHNEAFALSPSFNRAVLDRIYPQTDLARRLYRRLAVARVGAYLWRQLRAREFPAESRSGFDGLPGGDPVLTADQMAFLDGLREKVFALAPARLAWTLDLCRRSGVRVLYAVPTSNLIWPPASPTHGPGYAANRPAWEAKKVAAERAFRRHDFAAALAPLAAMERIDPSFATTYHLAGAALLRLGRTAEARAEFDRALDEIHLNRMVGTGQDGAAPSLVRLLAAAARERGVPVWDVGLAVRGGTSPERDADLFVDHLHFNAEGARRFAEGLVGELQRLGWVKGAGFASRSITP